jgi:hypothetical protein
MKKSRVASNALNNPKAGYSQLARLEPTVFWRRSRRLQLTALEQLSKMLEAKQESTRTQKSGHYRDWWVTMSLVLAPTGRTSPW